MWPYDYFHQVSTVEIDKKIGLNKTIFISIWFGGSNKKFQRQQTGKIELLKEIVSNLRMDKFSFQPRIENKSGEIFSKIQQEIIKSTFVICDLTPCADRKGVRFCDNVLLELGIAAAWKMEEQVIILWDKHRKGGKDRNFNSEQLPSDFRTHYVNEVDSGNKNSFKEALSKIIRNRFENLEYKKDILIKNAMSNLDIASLKFLRNQKGLLFADPPIDVISLATLRHLMALGIIRAIIYKNDWTFAYYLTKFGRIILEKEFGAELFPEIFADMLFVRYFRFDPKGEFKEKIDNWEEAYQKDFWKCLRAFNDFVPKKMKNYFKSLNKSDNKEDVDLYIFSRYLEELPLDYFKKKIYPIWETDVRYFHLKN